MQFSDQEEAIHYLEMIGIEPLPVKKDKRLLYKDNCGNLCEVKKDTIVFGIKK
jgi:hypothetical protein